MTLTCSKRRSLQQVVHLIRMKTRSFQKQAVHQRENSLLRVHLQIAQRRSFQDQVKQSHQVHSKSLVSDTATRSQPSREAKKTRFHDNPVSSIKAIPACTDKTKHPSTRNRRSPRFDVTDPDLLIPLHQAITAGIPDQGGAQPSFPPQSASLPASQQPSSSETTTKEPSVVLPVSPDAGTKTASESSSSSSESSSGTSSSEASSTSTSPSTGTTSSSSSASTSPEMREVERSLGSLLSQERDRLGHAIMRSILGGAKQHILVMQRAIEQQQAAQTSVCPTHCFTATPPVSAKAS